MFVVNDKMDKNMKLFKMLGALIDVSVTKENLENYKRIGMEIDEELYKNILEKIQQINEHNHSLEEELQYLEEIRNVYNQILEFQLSFKEKYKRAARSELKLSDLSKLNIEYIENRMSAISGYLMNLKNVEINKKKLQELNDELIGEEKKKQALDNKLFELDDILRRDFGQVEGRCIVDGNLQYTSVFREYEKIGYDFQQLLEDKVLLNQLLVNVESEREDVSEKVKAAEFCYNSFLTPESKQILNEINVEYFKIRYKEAMLKIISLLLQNSDSYSSFIAKRRDLLKLIEFRSSCLDYLGVQKSIDPFSRTKVKEQLDVILGLNDNSDIINKIRKEISQLNSWTEEMLSQNNNFLITLSDTKNLIENNIGFNDVDITPVISFDELLIKQTVANNQVVGVKNVPLKFNKGIVKQKTSKVLERVIALVVGNKKTEEKRTEQTAVTPELVIVPKTSLDLDLDISLEDSSVSEEKEEALDVLDAVETIQSEEELDLIDTSISDLEPEVVNETGSNDSFVDIFETVTPFDAPLLFSDRTDEKMEVEMPNIIIDPIAQEELDASRVQEIDTIIFGDLEDSNSNADNKTQDDFVEEFEMPEVFWSMDNDEVETSDVNEDDFDTAVNKLLFEENDTKTRKKVA